MSMIKEKIRILCILPGKNIPAVLLRLVKRVFIGSFRKVKIYQIDTGKIDQVFDSPSAKEIAGLFDNSKYLENFDEIPIFGNPDMKLKISDLVKNNWTNFYPSGGFNSKMLKDKRFIWEISRLQFLPLMANCIVFSNSDTRQSMEKLLLNTISGWRSANRFPSGINWESPLEVAIRSINILAAGAILSKKNILNESLKKELSVLLFDSFRYLENNLEYGDGLPSNHLIVEVCILFIISKAFLMDEIAARSMTIIEKTLNNQISTDGLLLESSLPYAAFVLEAYLLFVLVYATGKENEVDQKILNRIGEIYSSLISLAGENLIVPSIGDDDSARILRFDSISTDEPSIRNYLTAIYNKTFCKHIETEEKTDKLAGKAPAVLWLDHEAGFGSLRRGLCGIIFRFPGSREFRLGSHCHSDYLSFCLYFGNREIFGDPGSFLYSDHESRTAFRSEENHSSIVINDCLQREYLKSPFISFRNRKMGYDLKRAEDGLKIELYFKEKNEKYIRMGRSFTVPDCKNIKITDVLYSSFTNLNLRWSFILSPGMRIEDADETHQRTKCIRIAGYGLKVIFKLPAIFDIGVNEICYSRYYGQTELVQRISLTPGRGSAYSVLSMDQQPLFFEVHLET